MTTKEPSMTLEEIIEKLKKEVFTRDKYLFEWTIIHDKIYLIDNKNELLGIPTTLKIDELPVDKLQAMLDWLKYLNKED